VLVPSGRLTLVADEVSGPERRCRGATDIATSRRATSQATGSAIWCRSATAPARSLRAAGMRASRTSSTLALTTRAAGPAPARPARSRACHRVKQSPGWQVTQPRPGWHQWTTPAGRSYLQEPKRYPA